MCSEAGKAIPAVSVLLPVYNGERYVAKAVESILNQTFTDFEFIIIDDGSTDSSLVILQRYAAKDPRIRLISRENRKLIATLNEGIDLARAPLIARMDADDISLPERFARQVWFMNEHPEVLALGTQAQLILPDGGLMGHFQLPCKHEEIDSCLLSLGGAGLLHPTVLMRTDIVRRIGGYKAEYRHSEDNDLFLRLAENGALANLSDVLFAYRRHFGSICFTHDVEQRASYARAAVDACLRRGIPVPQSVKHPKDEIIDKTRAEILYLWGIRALKVGNVRGAVLCAGHSLLARPRRVREYWLLLCLVRDCVLRGLGFRSTGAKK